MKSDISDISHILLKISYLEGAENYVQSRERNTTERW